MCVFQCLNRHEQPSSLIRKGREFVLLGVSMPQSARPTFKQIIVAENAGDDDGFNASIGTSNLQAIRQSTMPGRWSLFQCLNRHEQPSSPLKAVGMAPTT